MTTPYGIRKNSAFILAACLFALSACQSPKELNSNREDELAAAGFIMNPANTPEREAMLQKLPQHKIIRRVNGDAVTYAYADWVGCNCLYAGTQAAFNEYRFNAQMERMADAQEMAAESVADDWGMWDPVESETIIYNPYSE